MTSCSATTDSEDSIEARRQVVQRFLESKSSENKREKLGQYTTPLQLAREIVAFVRTQGVQGGPLRFLDPALGTGVFFSALLKETKTGFGRALGFEIDSRYAKAASILWKKNGFTVRNSDFTSARPPSREAGRFNMIVCNPPYVRHHHIDPEDKLRLLASVSKRTGVTLSRFSGLQYYFVLMSQSWMAEDGLAAWLLPSEFLDLKHTRPLRDYLARTTTLIRIHQFDPKTTQFGDALVGSVVLFFRKHKPSRTHKVEFTAGPSLTRPERSWSTPSSALSVSPKWNSAMLKGPRYREGHAMPRLSDFFTIKRGVATGANSFFIVSRERAEQYEIPFVFLKPVLPSPKYLFADIVEVGENGEPDIDSDLFLIDCGLSTYRVRREYPTLWKYLQKGYRMGASKRYLCAHRTPWYAQEKREPALFLCPCIGSLRSEKPFRFILNRSTAAATNSYLLLYPKEKLNSAISKLPGLDSKILDVLNSISQELFRKHGRTYGAGLRKIEPGELRELSSEVLGQLGRLVHNRTRVSD